MFSLFRLFSSSSSGLLVGRESRGVFWGLLRLFVCVVFAVLVVVFAVRSSVLSSPTWYFFFPG